MATLRLRRFSNTFFKDTSASNTAQIVAGSATVSVYKQGSTVSSSTTVTTAGGGVAVSVYSTGRLLVNDTVQLGTDATKQMNVEEITSGTAIKLRSTTGSSISVATGDRLVIYSAVPTIYSEISGTTSIANPTTTNSRGLVEFYTTEDLIDIILFDSGSGLTTTLYTDNESGEGLYYDITAFGAIADGSTDNIKTIQAAITACNAAGGGTVFIPAGQFNVSGILVADSLNNINFLGVGRASRIHQSTANTSILSFTSSNYCSTRSLRLTGSGSLGTSGRGAIFASTSGAANYIGVSDCFIDSVGTCGISMKATFARIINNDIRTIKEHGILLTSSNDCTVADNTIESAGSVGSGTQAGIQLASCNRITATGNVIVSSEHEGIYFNTTTNSIASNNIIRSSGQSSIRFTLGSSNSALCNVCDNSNTASSATIGSIDVYSGTNHLIACNHLILGSSPGRLIRIQSGATECVVSGNYIPTVVVGGTGIIVAGNNTSIQGNFIADTTDIGVTISAATTGTKLLNNNVLCATPYSDAGTLTISKANTGGSGDTITTAIASAATIALPDGVSNTYTVSGTTTITSVTASWTGRVVTLLFSGALTFTDGSNLILAGNFTTAANRTIILLCDGTNWIELSRASN